MLCQAIDLSYRITIHHPVDHKRRRVGVATPKNKLRCTKKVRRVICRRRRCEQIHEVFDNGALISGGVLGAKFK